MTPDLPAPPPKTSSRQPSGTGRPGLRGWIPWVAPYLVAFVGFVAWRYTRKLPGEEWVLLANLAVPVLVPLVAAAVDGRWRTFRGLMVATWGIAALQAVVLFHSAGYRWMHFSEVDMGPIVLPFLLGYLAACSLLGAVAFVAAARLRRPRS